MTGFLITLFGYPIAVYGLHDSVLPIQVACLMLWFGLLELSFEIIYDIRDYPGDLKENIPTYAVVGGPWYAKRLVVLLDCFTFIFLFFGYAMGYVPYEHVVMNIGVVLKLLYFVYLTNTGFTEKGVVFLTWFYVFLQILYMILVIIIGPFRIISDLTHPQIILGVTTVLMFLSKSWYGNIKTIDNYSYWYSYVSIAIACCVAENTCIEYYQN
eukprot:UN25551